MTSYSEVRKIGKEETKKECTPPKYPTTLRERVKDIKEKGHSSMERQVKKSETTSKESRAKSNISNRRVNNGVTEEKRPENTSNTWEGSLREPQTPGKLTKKSARCSSLIKGDKKDTSESEIEKEAQIFPTRENSIGKKGKKRLYIPMSRRNTNLVKSSLSFSAFGNTTGGTIIRNKSIGKPINSSQEKKFEKKKVCSIDLTTKVIHKGIYIYIYIIYIYIYRKDKTTYFNE